MREHHNIYNDDDDQGQLQQRVRPTQAAHKLTSQSFKGQLNQQFHPTGLPWSQSLRITLVEPINPLGWIWKPQVAHRVRVSLITVSCACVAAVDHRHREKVMICASLNIGPRA